METIKKVIQVKEGLKLVTEMNRISLSVIASGSVDKVTVELDSENGEELENVCSIDYDDKKNELMIKEIAETERKQAPKSFLKIFTGKNTAVRSISKNASASASGLEGNLFLRSINGSLASENCTGEVSLESKNGRIGVGNACGLVDLVSKNGSIEINGGQGTLKVTTDNGSVRCGKCLHEKAAVNVKNGSIYYELPSIEKGSFTINSKNGAIRLIVPPELPYNVTAFNHNGRFNFGLPGNYETGKKNGSKYIKAFKGSGKVIVLTQNINGSISLISNKGRIMNKETEKKSSGLEFVNTTQVGSDEWKDGLKNSIKGKVMKNLMQAGIINGSGEKTNNRDDKKQQQEKRKASAGQISPEMKVLRMLEEGIISKDDAEKLINVMKGGE